MKKYIVALMCMFSFSAFAQSYTGYPDIPGTAVGYATEVISYTPTGTFSSTYKVSANTLGEPNAYSEGQTATSLGAGGNIVLGFSPLAIKKSGTAVADFYVYEVGGYESWDAYVSNDGSSWVKATPVFSDTKPTTSTETRGSAVGYDVDVIDSTENTFRYVKLVDTSLTTYAAPGADIDAVVITSGENLGTEVFVDTDSRNGKVYNLYQNDVTGAVGVKIVNKDSTVSYVPFSIDDSLKAIALSLQGDFNCDDEKDINVLATQTADNVQVNIIKQQDGTAIKTINNAVTK